MNNLLSTVFRCDNCGAQTTGGTCQLCGCQSVPVNSWTGLPQGFRFTESTDNDTRFVVQDANGNLYQVTRDPNGWGDIVEPEPVY